MPKGALCCRGFTTITSICFLLPSLCGLWRSARKTLPMPMNCRTNSERRRAMIRAKAGFVLSAITSRLQAISRETTWTKSCATVPYAFSTQAERCGYSTLWEWNCWAYPKARPAPSLMRLGGQPAVFSATMSCSEASHCSVACQNPMRQNPMRQLL